MPHPHFLLSNVWILLNCGLMLAYFSGAANLSNENGFLENAQLILLALTALLFILKRQFAAGEYFRYLTWGGALLATSFFLRELDLRRFDLNDWFVYFTSEKGRTYLTIAIWIPFLAHSYKHWRTITQQILCFMRSPSFVIFIMAAVWLLGGALFDKGLIESSHKYFMEEILELNGYAVFLLATFSMKAAEVSEQSCNMKSLTTSVQ